MSRNLLAGLGVLACVVAAGVGGYLAMQPGAPVVSAPEPGVSVSQDLMQTGAPQQPPVTTGTENVIPEAPPAAEPAATTTAPPNAKPAGTSPKSTVPGYGNRPAAPKAEPTPPAPAPDPNP